MAMKSRLRIIFFLVFCLPGLFITGYGAKLAADAMHLASKGSTAPGTIVTYERQGYFGKVGRRLCAVVEFSHAGSTHRFTDDWCNPSPKERPVGSSVKVVFDVGHPSLSRIHTWSALYGKSLFTSVIGAPWLLLGIALVMRVR